MAEEKVGFFKRLVNGLTKTRDSIVAGIDSIFSGYSNIDDDFYEEIEEILVMGDIGINTTTKIIDHLKERVAEEHITDPAECKQLLIESIKKQMDVGDTAYEFENRKSVVLVIGVNGVGKTTSVGARRFQRNAFCAVSAQADKKYPVHRHHPQARYDDGGRPSVRHHDAGEGCFYPCFCRFD